MATIGKNTMAAATKQLGTLLAEHAPEIDEAFALDDEAKFFPVALKVKFYSGRNGGIGHLAEISFTKEKIKDETDGIETNEHGGSPDPLFDQQDEERARRREILFRDFRPFAKLIGRILNKHRLAYLQFVGGLKFKKHAL